MPRDHDDDEHEQYDVQFAPGLSDEMRAEAERIFTALRRTRSERDQRVQEAATGESAPMLPLCPTLLASAEPCLLPLVEAQDCPHRAPGPAPAALAHLIGELRREVAEARGVASRLASAVRHLRSDVGLDVVLGRDQPWWLAPDEWMRPTPPA
ncbi:hypothetical protein [Blastococcus sp. PRF04-17]|uniref:hypothetical protein n=1 Tax=Blastococcus sp. PRF04-17 TaxID=2933797 RepID=UPI001FF3F709|nr:hypothetical protein [Blastococcus sp. PRF04-17]UOY00289.1 hypothetical protein MVA48_14900 [Blastococcus sp. PRF04-17]